jgi:serine O-acetyltransferase
MFENFRCDLSQARKHNVGIDWFSSRIKIFLDPGILAVASYRLSRWATRSRVPLIRVPAATLAFLIRCSATCLTGVHISPRADICPGLVVHTCYGVFISPVRMGRNCVVNQGVLISQGVRQIGDNVYFSAGAKVVGEITIGSNVMIAPNSLIIDDVPDNVTVLGVPAQIIWKGDKCGATRLQHRTQQGAKQSPCQSVVFSSPAVETVEQEISLAQSTTGRSFEEN